MNLLSKLMLGLGMVCLAIGCWSLIHWDVRDALLGIGFFVLSLFAVRRRRQVPG